MGAGFSTVCWQSFCFSGGERVGADVGNNFNIFVSFLTAATTPGPAFVTRTWSAGASDPTPLGASAPRHSTHREQCWPSGPLQRPGRPVPPSN